MDTTCLCFWNLDKDGNETPVTYYPLLEYIPLPPLYNIEDTYSSEDLEQNERQNIEIQRKKDKEIEFQELDR